MVCADESSTPTDSSIKLSVADFSIALEKLSNSDLSASNLLSQSVSNKLDKIELKLDPDSINFSKTLPDHHVKNRCSKSVTFTNIKARFEISNQSKVQFSAFNWHEPIKGHFTVAGNFYIDSDSEVALGIRALGKCVHYVDLSPQVSVSSPFNLQINLDVHLEQEFFLDKSTSEAQITLSPHLTMQARLSSWRPKVTLDNVGSQALGGYLKSSLAEYLEKIINRDFNPQAQLIKRIEQAQIKLNDSLIKSIGNRGKYVINIPRIPKDKLGEIHQFLSSNEYFSFPLTLDYLEQNSSQIAYAVLSGDKKAIKKISSAALACESVSLLSTPLPSISNLYQFVDGECKITKEQQGVVFADENCSHPLLFPHFLQFCNERANRSRLGNAKDISTTEKSGWTFSHGSRFSMGVEPQEKSYTFFQRKRYKSVPAGKRKDKVYIFDAQTYEQSMIGCLRNAAEESLPEKQAIANCEQKYSQTSTFNQLYSIDSGASVLDYYQYKHKLYSCIKRNSKPLIPWDNTKEKCLKSVSKDNFLVSVDNDGETLVASRANSDLGYFNCYYKKLIGFKLLPDADDKIKLQCFLSSPLSLKKKDIQSPVSNGNGDCQLEMRVYQNKAIHPNSKGVIAFHGGAWKWRQFGFLGLESEINKWVNDGFTVFTPFTRVVEDEDANPECQNASFSQVLDDVSDAVKWVSENGENYGVDSSSLVGLGHSSGGFNALYAGVNHPDLISKLVLFYPPTDIFGLFTQASKTQAKFEPAAIQSLKDILPPRIYLEAPSTASENIDWFEPYKLPEKIQSAPENFPDVYVVHGILDKWVPPPQSMALCNAFNGDPLLNYERYETGQYSCGLDSQLILVPNSGHMLDVCLPGVSCLAKDQKAQAMVKEALQSAREWAARE